MRKWSITTLTVLLFCAGTIEPCFGAMDVKLVYIGSEGDAALLGARQGLDEANLQGQFLGQKYILEARTAAAPVAELHGATAVLASLDAGAFQALAAALPGVPLFNLRATDDALRAACIANALHVIPGDAMARDAVAQWRKVHPGAKVTAGAWHGEFIKFAGRDLNKRYRAATGKGMDDHAWAGWAAVKMTSDSVARLNSADPGTLLAFLRDDLRFDGQKGAEMSFRASGQLRQPMLLVEDGRLVGEAPVRGVAGPDDLDTLGNTACR